MGWRRLPRTPPPRKRRCSRATSAEIGEEKEPKDATGPATDPAATDPDVPDKPGADKPAFAPGLLLRFSLGADVAEGVRREDLSEALAGFDAPKFIDFKMGDTGGCLRFEDAKTVANIVAKHGLGDAAAPPRSRRRPPVLFAADFRGDGSAAYRRRPRSRRARPGRAAARRGGRGRGEAGAAVAGGAAGGSAGTTASAEAASARASEQRVFDGNFCFSTSLRRAQPPVRTARRVGARN